MPRWYWITASALVCLPAIPRRFEPWSQGISCALIPPGLEWLPLVTAQIGTAPRVRPWRKEKPVTTHSPVRNLELKVGCNAKELERVRDCLVAAGVALVTLGQVDTYFAASTGRLKLRETVPAPDDGTRTAELVAYVRPDTSGPRWSSYHRVPVAGTDAAALKAALASTVGVLIEVAKTRTVGVRGRTRIHLDEVRGLGAFVELETVIAGDDEAGADEEMAETAALLGLDRLLPIPGSYSDLLLATRHGPTDAVT